VAAIAIFAKNCVLFKRPMRRTAERQTKPARIVRLLGSTGDSRRAYRADSSLLSRCGNQRAIGFLARVIVERQFAAPDRNVRWRFESEAHILPFDFQDSDDDAISDDHSFTQFSA